MTTTTRRHHQELGFSQDQGTVNVSRWATFARRLLNLKGPSLQGLNPEFSVSISESDRLDYWALAGVRPFSQSFALAAAAAKFNLWALVNPANSGLLVVVEQVIFQAAAGDDVQVQMRDAGVQLTAKAGFAEANLFPSDSRLIIGAAGSLGTRVQTAQDASTVIASTYINQLYRNTTQQNFVAGNAGTQIGRPIAVLSPNNMVYVFGATLNVAQVVTFVGYERTLELSELKP